jgi:hypothetical protein
MLEEAFEDLSEDLRTKYVRYDSSFWINKQAKKLYVEVNRYNSS